MFEQGFYSGLYAAGMVAVAAIMFGLAIWEYRNKDKNSEQGTSR